MGGQFGGVAFVVWRESVEALLVIGILDAWLVNKAALVNGDAGMPHARRYLWAGVVAGLAVAAALAALIVELGDTLSDEAQQTYRTAMVLVAAGLIIQMVAWMRRQGRTLKSELEGSLARATSRGAGWGVLVLALIAVAREGSETVVFLTGILSAGGETGRNAVVAGLIGFAAAILTYAALRLAGRRLPWHVFFKVTELLLLFLAASLVVSGIDGLIDLDVLPTLGRRLWDTSAVLSDGGAFGGFIATLTGYRAQPNPMEVVAYVLYWGIVVAWLYRPTPRQPLAKEA